MPWQWPGVNSLDDSFFARAYAALDGGERALLKLCIARLHRIFGDCSAFATRSRHFAEGFELLEEEKPADWALVACPANCSSPAALLAVVMPAILARVKALGVCFTFSGPAPRLAEHIDAPLLAALELAGIEEAHSCLATDLAGCLADPELKPDRGRLVCLGPAAGHEELALTALRAGTPVMMLPATPAYFSMRLNAVYGQRFRPRNAEDEELCATDNMVRLALDEEHEAVWIWPELTPAWFRCRRMKLFSLP